MISNKRLKDTLSHIKSVDRYAILRGAIGFMLFVTIATLGVIRITYLQSRDAAIETLTESESQSSAKLKLAVNLGEDRLYSLSHILSGYGSLYSKESLQVLSSVGKDSLFSHVALRFPNDTSLQSDGRVFSNIEWTRGWTDEYDTENDEAMVGSRTSSALNGKEIVRIFVPIISDGKKKAEIYGVLETDKLSSNFISSGFDGESSLIVFESGTGNVIMDTGSWLGFAGSAIGSISKLSYEKGFSGSKIFSDVTNGKSGYTIIKTDIGKMVCSYAPVGVSDWYMMQLVPESKLFAASYKTNIMLLIDTAVVFLGMLIFILWTYSRVEKVKQDRKSVDYQVNMRDKILATAFADTSMRIFIYYRQSDEIKILKNGSGVNEDSERIKGGVDYIASYEKLDADDRRKMKNSFELIGYGNSIKLTVQSRRTETPVFLRYTLASIRGNGKSESAIICTARDVTESELNKKKMLDVESFRNSVVTYKTTGLELCLERNTWRFVWNNEPYFDDKGITVGEYLTNYDRDLEKLILPAIQYSDREKFAGGMNRLNLLESFRRGTTEMSFEYRILGGASQECDYEYRIMEIHMLRDKSTDEAKANVYIRNVGKDEMEKFSTERQSDARRSIVDFVCRVFLEGVNWIGYAELENNTLYVVSSHGTCIEKEFIPENFDRHMDYFISNSVHPEDRCVFHSVNSAEYLKKHLTHENPIETSFRKCIPDSEAYSENITTVYLADDRDGVFHVLFVERSK